MLTGARVMEVSGVRWDEIDGDVLRVGAERSKNRRSHEVPLSPQALTIVAGLHRRDERVLVFGSGTGPFSGWSSSKAALDGRMLEALKRENGSKTKLQPWRLHDLRRTAATRMADLGVQPHVVEAVLNHISGSKADVAGVYNRASYAAEKRAALTLWGEHVAKLTGGA